ncbi:hypothetical protein G6F57_014362 [Rhizopus arrhizus]|nr:hypothetical protein G6F57_014362 [Rhizopus arrhizus]
MEERQPIGGPAQASLQHHPPQHRQRQRTRQHQQHRDRQQAGAVCGLRPVVEVRPDHADRQPCHQAEGRQQRQAAQQPVLPGGIGGSDAPDGAHAQHQQGGEEAAHDQ